MKVALCYSPVFKEHRPYSVHPECPSRLVDIINYLEAKNVLEKVPLISFEQVDENILRLVHASDYIEKVKVFSEEEIPLDADTYICRKTFSVALSAVSAVISACKRVLSEYDFILALVRPPGHHAGVSGVALGAPSQGFCIFNNVAIAAKWLIEEYKLKKIAIVDLDCHHGNGTQEIFEEDPRVLYISLHEDPRLIYPGTGFIEQVGKGEAEGTKVNIPLPPLTGDKEYLRVIDEIVLPILLDFKPDFLLLSAGFDAHYLDPLTDLSLSSEGYAKAYLMVVCIVFKKLKVKCVASLEGGYSAGMPETIYYVVKLAETEEYDSLRTHTTTHSSLKAEVLDTIEYAKRFFNKYWKLK